jgi:hypothetical protein
VGPREEEQHHGNILGIITIHMRTFLRIHSSNININISISINSNSNIKSCQQHQR